MLTDSACKDASCRDAHARIRHTDSGALYLEVTPNGSKRWFAKYRFGGKERRLALGNYPAVSLKVIETRIGVEASGSGKPKGRTKALICVHCMMKVERVVCR